MLLTIKTKVFYVTLTIVSNYCGFALVATLLGYFRPLFIML